MTMSNVGRISVWAERCWRSSWQKREVFGYGGGGHSPHEVVARDDARSAFFE